MKNKTKLGFAGLVLAGSLGLGGCIVRFKKYCNLKIITKWQEKI